MEQHEIEALEAEALQEGVNKRWVNASHLWQRLIDVTHGDPYYELEQEYYLEERNNCLCKARMEMDNA